MRSYYKGRAQRVLLIKKLQRVDRDCVQSAGTSTQSSVCERKRDREEREPVRRKNYVRQRGNLLIIYNMLVL